MGRHGGWRVMDDGRLTTITAGVSPLFPRIFCEDNSFLFISLSPFTHRPLVLRGAFRYLEYMSIYLVQTGLQLVWTDPMLDWLRPVQQLVSNRARPVYAGSVFGCIDILNRYNRFGPRLPPLGSKKPDRTGLSNTKCLWHCLYAYW
jgi:hypothetical protein